MYDKTDGYYSMLDEQRAEQNCSLCTGCHTARQLSAHPRHGDKAWLCDCTLSRGENGSLQVLETEP
jgi:hypothetical protein